jgi:transposase
MSLRKEPISEIPEDTRRVAQALYPKGKNRWVTLRDELGPIYTDDDFADLFSHTGQPGKAPWRLALVMVMQYAESLTDEETETAVCSRIDWKYALSLSLEDRGFDASVLSEFRSRLIRGEAELRLLDKLLKLCQKKKLLREKGRQRTDSTQVIASARQLSRLENVGETMRQALDTLAVSAPEWLLTVVEPEWAERYRGRMDGFRLPKGEKERLELGAQIGRDGDRLLTALWEAPTLSQWRFCPAVETLRAVWVQQYAPTPEGPVWREAQKHGLAPAPVGIRSPHDPEARYSEKRDEGWVGYQVHLTETCDKGLPHLITQVETTIAPVPDSEALPLIQADLARRGLTPKEQINDAGYVTARRLVESEQIGVTLCGPPREDSSWQARQQKGYAAADFRFDWERKEAICPGGQRSSSWQETQDGQGKELVKIKYAVSTCRPCGQREQCTKIDRRILTIQPRAETEALEKARLRAQTPEYKKLYALRAGIEGTISQGVRRSGLRVARYVGLAKTHLQHLLTAVALNVIRLVNWLTGVEPAQTRRSAFVSLMKTAPLPG